MTGQSTARSITPAPAPDDGRDVAAAASGELDGGALRARTLLKRWRYVGIFDERLMACAATVHVGAARQSFWALHLRDDGSTRERTRLLPRRRELMLDAGRLLLRDRGVELDVRLDEDDGFAAVCRNGRGHVWTRKQAGIAARGTLALDGSPPREIDARAVIDDSAGRHPRRTEWWWSAGVGHGPDGVALAWNLVSGVNDPPSGSERAVWVDGSPSEAPPVEFSPDLLAVRGADGSELRFAPEAERTHSQNALLVKSEYRAPFGTFAGTLPGGVELAHGLGVVEWHRARW